MAENKPNEVQIQPALNYAVKCPKLLIGNRQSAIRTPVMQIGDVISWQRRFTEEEIRAFARFSGDEGQHHLVPDEHGRLMAHGLLTATLPTKIGGDMNFIARQMTFEFHRPVFAGDTIECQVTLIELEPGDEYTRMAAQFVCRNQTGKVVMTGQTHGVIRNS